MGIKSTGNSHQAYYKVKKSFDHNTISYINIYYKLLNAKEDSLLTTAATVTYEGAAVTVNEDLTPCNQSDVV